MEPSPKRGNDKINRLRPRRKSTAENKSYCRAWTHKREPSTLISIRKKSNARMEPCYTLALTGNHSDVWALSSTLWNLLLKKLSIRRNRKFEIPTDIS